MIDDLRKSINAILYERMTSPLYGTLAISWIIWNWRIVYLTLFIDEKRICTTKIDYIINNYSNPHILYTGPIISTIILITIMPLIANGAYWLSLRYDKWKYDKKNEVERSKLLTIEQSIQIRNEISEQEERFSKLVAQKDGEIDLLRRQFNELNQSRIEDKNNQNKLRILRALYGANGNTVDVTKYLINLIKANRLELTVTNALFDNNDPTPGQRKTLEIIYELNQKVSTAVVLEGDSTIIH